MTDGPDPSRQRGLLGWHAAWFPWIGWALLFVAGALLGLPLLYAAALAALPWLL